jgi:NitT/TauT family transport system permease protein
MKKTYPGTAARRWPVVLLQLLIVGLGCVYWQYGAVDVKLFSRPSIIYPRLIEIWHGAIGLAPLWRQVAETLGATVAGLALGIAIGFIAGVVFAEFSVLRDASAPYLNAINAVPRVAWVPVLTMVFGFGLLTKVIMSGLIVFLVVFFNVLDAASHAPQALLRNVAVMGGSRWASVRDVRIWAGLGALIASLPSAVALALVGVVFAESLAAESGLGALMFNAMNTGNPNDLMISATLLALIGVVMAKAVQFMQRLLSARLPPDMNGERK